MVSSEKNGIGALDIDPSPREELKDFALLMQAVLEVDGIPSAVLLANTSTEHRFTGVYRFDDHMLTNLFICDSQTGLVTTGPAAPVHETYCLHILQSGRAFTVGDSVVDPRLAGHPKRAQLRSYCGAPMFDQQGHLAGTVCHFDAEPGKLGAADFEQIHIAAMLLQDKLLV